MSNRNPLSKGEKSLFFWCAFAVLPLAAVAFTVGHREADPAWNIPPAAKRPTPNGYDFYVAAMAATVRFKPEVDPASDTTLYVPGSAYALKNYSLARRKQWLAANAKAFALVNQGLHTPSMSPDLSGGLNRTLSHFRQLARDISARTRTFQMEGRPMLATQSALDGMQMAQDTTRGGGLLPRLVGVAIEAIGRRPLDDFDHTINLLNAAEARAAAQRLEKLLAQEPSAVQTITEQKRVNLVELRKFFTSPNWRNAWGQGVDTGETGEDNIFQGIQSQTISKTAIYDNVNRVDDVAIQSVRLPYSQAIRIPIDPNLDVFSRLFTTSSPAYFIKSEARSNTSNNMFLLRLALRAYIAEHGAAPPTLSALVPGILHAIPTDIYNDGKPLYYVPKGATYRLWSVGPDMKNDGGIPLSRRPGASTRWPADNSLDNTGDFVAGLCR